PTPHLCSLSLHDALPIYRFDRDGRRQRVVALVARRDHDDAILRRKPEPAVLILEARRLPAAVAFGRAHAVLRPVADAVDLRDLSDRKSTRLNSSHVKISY